MRACSYILFSTAVVSLVSAQEQSLPDTSDFWEDNRWEKILETAVQADENSTAAEETTQFEDNPLNLNSASAEELHRIPAVSNLIASRIIDRRNRKRFTSVNELLEVDGITPEVLTFIRRFVRIGRIKDKSNFSASFLRNTTGQYGGQEQDQETRFHHAMNLKLFNRFIHPLKNLSWSGWFFTSSSINVFLAWKMAA